MKDAHPHDRGGAQMWVAHLKRESGKIEEALDDYSKVLKIDGAHPHDLGGAQAWVGVMHYELAKKAFLAVSNSKTAHEVDKGRVKTYLEKMN